MDDADWKRWAKADPFKQSSRQIVETYPEGVGPHSSFDEYCGTSRLKGGVHVTKVTGISPTQQNTHDL